MSISLSWILNRQSKQAVGSGPNTPKLTANQEIAKFLDELEPELQKIKSALWGGHDTIVTAEKIAEMQENAVQIRRVARKARVWIKRQLGLVDRRMKVCRKFSPENQSLIDRLNIADLTLRSYLSVVDIVLKAAD